MTFDPKKYIEQNSPPPVTHDELQEFLAPAPSENYEQADIDKTLATWRAKSATSAAPHAAPSMPIAALEKFQSGLSLGFAPTIHGGVGAVKAALERGDIGHLSEDYMAARDRARTREDEISRAYPIVSNLSEGAGSLASGLVASPVSVAAKGGGVLSKLMARSAPLAAQGAVSGYAQSREETAGGQLRDAVMGGLITAGVGEAGRQTVGRVIRRAPEAATKARVKDVIVGEEGTVERRFGSQPVALARELVDETLQAYPEARVALRQPPSEGLPVIRELSKKLAAKNDPLYRQLPAATLQSINRELDAYGKSVKKYMLGDPSQHSGNQMTLDVIDKLKDSAKAYSKSVRSGSVSTDVVPARAIQNWHSNAIKTAQSTVGGLNPGMLAQAKEDGAAIARTVRDAVFDKWSAASPELAETVNQIRKNNRPIAGLIPVKGALKLREIKENSGKIGAETIRDARDSLALGGTLGGFAGVTSKDPITAIAYGAMGAALPPAVRAVKKIASRASEKYLEPLERSARAGAARALLARRLAEQSAALATVPAIARARRDRNEKK